jgi:hypothetical protein
VPLLISFIDVGILINNSSTNQKEFAMKNLFLTCMVLFLVFTIGCQESSITDPTQPLAEIQDSQFTNDDLIKNDPGNVNHNIIGLKYQLADPGGGGICQLTGQVKYETTIISSITTVRKVWVKVRLEMVALLCRSSESDHPPRWTIEKKTEDRVLLGNTDPQTKTLYKAYNICNRGDVKLYVEYLITSKSVKVVKVYLKRCGLPRAIVVD